MRYAVTYSTSEAMFSREVDSDCAIEALYRCIQLVCLIPDEQPYAMWLTFIDDYILTVISFSATPIIEP